MLSAQTTDEAVNKLTTHLFKKISDSRRLCECIIARIGVDLHSIGLYRNKAKNIKAMAETLQTRFNGVVPASHKELITLPGVGRKTANVVMAEGFGYPAIAVDTHVERISKRLGFAKADDTVLTVEKKLMKTIPKK